jgi:hypothetical protein
VADATNTFRSTFGWANASPSGPFATEAACNQACKEGACCEGTTCSVKPACQCSGTGKTFRGVGTTCSTSPCGCCGGGELLPPGAASVAVNRTFTTFSGYLGRVNDESGSDSASFAQQGQSLACSRDLFGDTPTHGVVSGYVSIARDQNYSCRLVVQIGWPGGSCGAVGYSWPFVAGQVSYSVTYYGFLFLEMPTYAQLCVSSLSPSIPSAPSHPRSAEGRSYVFGGERKQINIEVSIA